MPSHPSRFIPSQKKDLVDLVFHLFSRRCSVDAGVFFQYFSVNEGAAAFLSPFQSLLLFQQTRGVVVEGVGLWGGGKSAFLAISQRRRSLFNFSSQQRSSQKDNFWLLRTVPGGAPKPPITTSQRPTDS